MSHLDEWGETDIIKCRGKGCKDKNKCLRFLVRDNPFRQAYGNFYESFEKADKIDGKCEYFLDKKIADRK
jgi:hypothetical protein